MPDGGYVHPEFLVETDWLAAHLADPKVVVLDCTVHLIPDPKITYTVKSGREDFEKGHIPGAQFIDVQADLSDNDRLPLRFMLPKPAGFAAAMRRFGVSDDSKVVTYSTANPQWATRVWWVLRCYGFDNCAVLNGGFQKWSREGRAVETGSGKARPAGALSERPAKPLMADKNDVLAAIGDGAVCTINALQAPQHAGTGGNTYGRPGRIAGSVNVPTVGLVDPAQRDVRPEWPAVHGQTKRFAGYLDVVMQELELGIRGHSQPYDAGSAKVWECADRAELEVQRS